MTLSRQPRTSCEHRTDELEDSCFICVRRDLRALRAELDRRDAVPASCDHPSCAQLGTLECDCGVCGSHTSQHRLHVCPQHAADGAAYHRAVLGRDASWRPR